MHCNGRCLALVSFVTEASLPRRRVAGLCLLEACLSTVSSAPSQLMAYCLESKTTRSDACLIAHGPVQMQLASFAGVITPPPFALHRPDKAWQSSLLKVHSFHQIPAILSHSLQYPFS